MSEFYYKSLYKKHYIPANEIQERCNNAVRLSAYLATSPDVLEPIWDWFLNFYFYGLDENSQVVAFEEDIKRFAKDGYDVIPLVFHEAVGSIAENSSLGIICDMWDPNEGLDEQEKERVIEILEKIKIKTPMSFDLIHWDYFIENCWKQVFSNVFEYYFGTSFKRATENIVVKKINKILKKEGLTFGYIKELSPSQKISCLGVDMSNVWS